MVQHAGGAVSVGGFDDCSSDDHGGEAFVESGGVQQCYLAAYVLVDAVRAYETDRGSGVSAWRSQDKSQSLPFPS